MHKQYYEVKKEKNDKELKLKKLKKEIQKYEL